MIDPETSALDIARAVASGETSAVAVTEAALARIGKLNPLLNAFTDVTATRARKRAAALDAQRAAGDKLGPLAGVPFAVKNLFDVAGLPTRAGSLINRELPPAERDSPLIARLEAAGAVLLGALNMGEYAYDFTGENVHDGPSRNPHDTTRMTGGSSGGSGGAVAGRLVPLALGSDTNGSIRVPSSLCGIFGLKPTYGRLSRAGSFPFVTSLDHLGPFARQCRRPRGRLRRHAGPRSRRSRMRPAARGAGTAADRTRERRAAHRNRRRLFPRRRAGRKRLAAVAKVAAALGVTREIELPQAARARAAAYVITAAEGAGLHLDRLRRRARDYDPAVRDRLIAGAMIPAAMVANAQKFRRWYRDRVLALFDEVDAILAPATPCTAPLLGQETFVVNGVGMPVRANLGLYTQPISFIGLPVVVVPVPRRRCRSGSRSSPRRGARTSPCASPMPWRRPARSPRPRPAM